MTPTFSGRPSGRREPLIITGLSPGRRTGNPESRFIVRRSWCGVLGAGCGAGERGATDLRPQLRGEGVRGATDWRTRLGGEVSECGSVGVCGEGIGESCLVLGASLLQGDVVGGAVVSEYGRGGNGFGLRGFSEYSTPNRPSPKAAAWHGKECPMSNENCPSGGRSRGLDGES